jgi:hypothetical protein
LPTRYNKTSGFKTLKRFALILTVCFGSPVICLAQPNVLVGSITVGKNAVFSYKLQFEDSAGKIKGYSVTDLQGPNQTKTAVKGTVNKSKKELVFTETHIISTRTALPPDSFCFVHARLKLAGMQRGKVLKGSFTGYKANGTTVCARGSLVLYSASDVLDKLMNLLPGPDSVVSSLRTRLDSIKRAPARIIELPPGQSFTLEHNTTGALMEVWDDKHIDGDVISVRHNGKTVLNNYTLSGIKKSLTLPLSGTDTITVVALNEGSEPSNTARMNLRVGTDLYPFNAGTTLKEPVYIILRHKDR